MKRKGLAVHIIFFSGLFVFLIPVPAFSQSPFYAGRKRSCPGQARELSILCEGYGKSFATISPCTGPWKIMLRSRLTMLIAKHSRGRKQLLLSLRKSNSSSAFLPLPGLEGDQKK